jgi:hypothetical protein
MGQSLKKGEYIRFLTYACGLPELRHHVVSKLEMWLMNPKISRPAQVSRSHLLVENTETRSKSICFGSGFRWSESKSGKYYPKEKEIKMQRFQQLDALSDGLVPFVELESPSWRTKNCEFFNLDPDNLVSTENADLAYLAVIKKESCL